MITSTSPHQSGLHRRAAFWSTLALLSLPIVIAARHNVGALDRAIGDSAIIQLQVDDMPGRLPLVGVYSRFGFHHPGPMLYYVVAAPVHLLGASGLAIAGALVAIASLGGILLVLYRRGGSVLFALGVVLDLVLVRSMALDVLSAWNPYILILPFALAILLTWSVWCSDWRALPWLAFVGSFVVQSHIGTAPTIALMFLSAAVWTTIARVRRRCPTRPVVLAIVVLAVVWLPPLIEQFTNQPGNISQILSIGSGGSGEPTLGLTDALHLLSHLLGRTNPLTVASTAPIELITAARTTPILLLMVPAIALALSAFLAWRLRLDDALRLTGLLFGLCLTSLVFLTSISGLPYLYLVRWIIVITCIIWMNLIWILIAVVRTRITVRPPGAGGHRLLGGGTAGDRTDPPRAVSGAFREPRGCGGDPIPRGSHRRRDRRMRTHRGAIHIGSTGDRTGDRVGSGGGAAPSRPQCGHRGSLRVLARRRTQPAWSLTGLHADPHGLERR